MAVQVEVKRLLFQRLQQHIVPLVGSLVLSSLLRSCRKPFMHIWVNSLSHVLSAVSGAKASFCSGVRDKITKRHRDRCHTAQLCRRKVLNRFVRKGRKERKSCEGLRWDQRVRAGGLPETYLRNICPLPPSPTSPSYYFVSSESVLFRHRLFLFRCTYGCSLSRWAAQGPHWKDDDGGGGGKGAGSGGVYYTSMIFNPICLPAYLTTASNGGSMKSSMYMLIISCLTPRPSVSYLSSFTSTCHHLLLLSLILINGVAVIYKRMSTSMIPLWTWYHIFFTSGVWFKKE